ncbi:MAG: translation initiation factor IF-3 [Stappiaceae bacterium]
MSEFFALFFRLIWIVLSFVAAVVAAGVFLAWGFFDPTFQQQDPVGTIFVLIYGVISGSLIGGVVFVPALVIISVAEIFSWRSLVLHLAIGGGIGVAAFAAGSQLPAEAGLPSGWTVAATAGFIGGFTYWLLAGRNAGAWRTVRPK